MDRRDKLVLAICLVSCALAILAFNSARQHLFPNYLRPSVTEAGSEVAAQTVTARTPSATAQQLTLITGDTTIPLVIVGDKLEGQTESGQFIRGTISPDQNRITWEQIDSEGHVLSHGTFTRHAAH